MSHLALRRVMIRLLHDPAFAAEVYANPADALADVPLSADERKWLTAQPAAAWRTDPARPARVLAALAEEFPATVVLATEYAAGFLRSPQFHDAIQARGSLALAFGDHLRGAPDPRARAVAALERAIAEVRRAVVRPAASDVRVHLAPTAVITRVPRGALALLQAIRAGAEAGALAREEDSLAREDEWVLATGDPAGEITLEALEPALAAVLERARDGCSRDDFLTEACRQGAEPDEARELLVRLAADGLLAVGDADSAV